MPATMNLNVSLSDSANPAAPRSASLGIYENTGRWEGGGWGRLLRCSAASLKL